MIRSRLVVFVTAIFTSAFLVHAQDRPELRLTMLEPDAAPTIDGVIGDGEWDGVPSVDEPFIQVEPAAGLASPFRTLIRLAQTEAALYVAVEALDPDPERIAVAVTGRDGDMEDDDSIGVMLDTFSDRRTGYVFVTYALATQMDARIADNGRTLDTEWDSEWRCASRRTDRGWVAEFEIPFEILRYQRGEDRSWGLSFRRTIPRRLETSVWPGPTESEWRVSSFGTLSGVDLRARAGRT